MQIEYKNKTIEEICTDAGAARKKYGQEMAGKIHQRVDELASAETVVDMLQHHIGRCHALQGNREGQYALDLVQPYRLVFAPRENGIQIALIHEIVDYH